MSATPTEQTRPNYNAYAAHLRDWIRDHGGHEGVFDFLDAALREQTRITVEWIREALRSAPRDEGPPIDRGSRFYVEVLRILEVAAVPPAPGPGEEDEGER